MTCLLIVFALFVKKQPNHFSPLNPGFSFLLSFFFLSRMENTQTGMLSLRMAMTRQRRLSRSLRLNPRVLRPLQPRLSQGSSGEESTNSCSPASDTAWDWGTCGVSRTSAIVTEEVSMCKNVPCPLKSQKLTMQRCVSVMISHTYLGTRPSLALPLGVCYACDHATAATSPWKLELKAVTNPVVEAELMSFFQTRLFLPCTPKSRSINMSELEWL